MREEVDLTLIIGPGHHHHKLVDALKTSGYSFEVFKCYPVISKTIFNKKGIEIHSKNNLFLSKIIQLLWAICLRIKFLKYRNYQNYMNFVIFDRWVSKNYSPSSKLLYAWSQVSLKTIESFKKKNKSVILENPMIHINEWNNILDSEYKKNVPNKYRSYEIDPNLNRRMKREYELANEIVLLSDFAERTFIENGISANKLVKVNLYADEEYSRTKKVVKANSATRLLFVGRIDVLKGIPRLIEVMDKLIISYPEIKLILVGELKEEVSHLFDKFRPYVELVGVKSKKELQAYYESSDILILPSVQESFGLVILEALSHGMNVLGSKNSGAPDIANNCDFVKVFDPLNEKELEDLLRVEIANNSTNNVSQCNLNRYSKSFYEKQIVEILRQYLTPGETSN